MLISGTTTQMVLCAYLGVFYWRKANEEVSTLLFFTFYVLFTLALLIYVLTPMVMVADAIGDSLAFVYPNRALWNSKDEKVRRTKISNLVFLQLKQTAAQFVDASRGHPGGVQIFRTITIDRGFVITVKRSKKI